ncbi:MAG: helix-turn-helix transcriptional regulator [Bacilli bacterium]
MKIDRLKEIREDRDYTQIEIAKILKITQAQYSRYEQGINLISTEKLSLLADFYDVSVDYLLLRTDIKNPYPTSIVTNKK